MVYEPLHHALQIWQLYAFLKIKLRRILDILWAFLTKQLSTISYPTRTRGILVKYTGLIDTGGGRDSNQHDIKQFG